MANLPAYKIWVVMLKGVFYMVLQEFPFHTFFLKGELPKRVGWAEQLLEKVISFNNSWGGL